MDQKEQILGALKNLAPKSDEKKALLEFSNSAIALSSLLYEPQGLVLIEYVINELDCGKKIFIPNQFLDLHEFDLLNLLFYEQKHVEELNILLNIYHLLWSSRNKKTANELYRALYKLFNTCAIDTSKKELVLNICTDCKVINEIENQTCKSCNQTQLLKVYSVVLNEDAMLVLSPKTNQYLEIYVKECLRKSGITLVGAEIKTINKTAYTNIRYQIDGREVEADIHGISNPLCLFLCETKTSKKLTQNDIEPYDAQYNRLIEKVRNITSMREIPHRRIIITTGEFDQNINIKSYVRRGWEFIDRSRISNLTEEFKRIQQEL